MRFKRAEGLALLILTLLKGEKLPVLAFLPNWLPQSDLATTFTSVLMLPSYGMDTSRFSNSFGTPSVWFKKVQSRITSRGEVGMER